MKRSRKAVGIAVDGREVRVALLARKRGGIRIEQLEMDLLPESFGEECEIDDSEGNGTGQLEGTEEDAFGVENEIDPDNPRFTRQGVILGLFHRLGLRRWRFGVNIPSSKVYYHELERSVVKGNGRKAKIAAREELERSCHLDLPEHAIDIQNVHEERALVTGHDEGLEIVTLLDDARSFLSGGVSIEAVSTNEITLMNLVRAGYRFIDDETVAVVHVGRESSRIIFMRENKYLGLSSVIHDGYGSPKVLDALIRKILLEQDVSNIPEIDFFLLSGDCGGLEAKEYFASQFPGTRVDYLVPPQLDAEKVVDDQNDIAAFSVPIGLAWQALGCKNGTFYKTNFLPKRMKNSQSAYNLGWHGYLILGLIGAAAGGFINEWHAKASDIRTSTSALGRLETIIGETEADLNGLGNYDKMLEEIALYESDIEFVRSLAGEGYCWNPLLKQIAMESKTLGGVWFESFASRGDIVMVRGRSRYRSRIPDLSGRLGSALLQSVVSLKAQDRFVYQFDMGLRAVPGTDTPDTESGEAGTAPSP